MKVKHNVSLLPYNTFKVEAKADNFIEIASDNDIVEFSKQEQYSQDNVLVLGGGSNILFTQDFKGTILHSIIDTIEVLNETEEHIEIKCGSGLNWDWFVGYCVNRDWCGIENLSDIPGNIGSSAVQNIGAYGVEVKDCIVCVSGIDYTTGIPFNLSNEECIFEYRNSIFKRKPTLFISHITFRLNKKAILVTHYGNLEEQLIQSGERSIQNVRKIIINTRNKKLPSVDDLGSGGSFFKNPIVDSVTANKIKTLFPESPVFNLSNGSYKLSAAWLIDKAGLKGKSIGNVGTYIKQPLVIVNHGNASGKEITDFSKFIQEEVFKKFNIMLEPEVIIM